MREPDPTAKARRPWLAAVPKAELHLHLEGSLPPAFADRLAQRHGCALHPAVADAVQRGAGRYHFDDFRTFIEIYLALTDLLRTEDDYADAVVEIAALLAAQGVRWAEITFTPVTHQRRGVLAEVFMAGLERGREGALERHGIELRWVFDIVRHLPEQAEPTLALAVEHAAARGGAVIGLGLAGPEARSAPYDRFAPVFAEARAEGLWALPHAGEHAGADSVRAAVEQLDARRIGHGIRALEDPSVVKLLRDRDVALEVCPHSNVALGVVPSLAEHPVQRLRDAGVALTLATDDAPLFGTTLLDTYLDCAEHFAWSDETLRELCAESLRRAAMPTDTRTQLLAELDEAST